MSGSNLRWTSLDLAALGCVAAVATFAAITSDREFLANRAWLAATAATVSAVPELEVPAARMVQDVMAVLYAASPGLAYVAYRPRRGRPPRRNGPGRVALAIAAGLVCWSLASYGWSSWAPSSWTGVPSLTTIANPPTFWTFLPSGLGVAIARAILAAWLYLAVVGGWRRDYPPMERAGRWVGFAWVLAAAAAWGVEILRWHA